MATLRYSQIRVHPSATIKYIANEEKMLAAESHDVANVLNYMGEKESVSRVYTFSRHCSPAPDLAEKQMELYRQRYYASKKARPRDGELLGIHFFISYTEDDNPSPETMTELAMALCTHPLLRNFPSIGANHFDKSHRHSHIYISQFSADGKPRKMGLTKADFHELRRYMNRLCVERGLSIIDLPALRYGNPEYSAWVDGVIAEGKVTVHSEREEHRRSRCQKATTRQIYYKWMRRSQERKAEEYELLTPEQWMSQEFFTSFDCGAPYVASGGSNRVYGLRLYDDNGHRRSTLELTVQLVLMICRHEGNFIQQQDRELFDWLKSAKRDWTMQDMYNSMRTAMEMNIESPNDVPAKILDCGRQMNALRREQRRHEASIAKHELIIMAWENYQRVRCNVEGVEHPDWNALQAYRQAYAILARNQVLTEAAFSQLRSRYDFERRKVVDYEARLKELNRQYRDLKYLKSLTRNPAAVVERIFEYSDMAAMHTGVTLDLRIEQAREEANKVNVSTDEKGATHYS